MNKVFYRNPRFYIYSFFAYCVIIVIIDIIMFLTYSLDIEFLVFYALLELPFGILILILFINTGGYWHFSQASKIDHDKKIKRYDEKTKNLYNSTEKKIKIYLKSNPGSAYSSKVLLNRIEENTRHPNFRKYIIKNGERILNNMISEGIIKETYHNRQRYFFIPGD